MTLPKTTHSAALEPPNPIPYCQDCEYLTDYCKCGEPGCENCGKPATFQVRYEDDTYWFCDRCDYEGERIT